MNTPIDEPMIPLRLQRPLAAAWISLALHVAVIALVQVAPPASTNSSGSVIEVRLVSTHAAATEADTPDQAQDGEALLVLNEAAEGQPVVQSVAPLLAESAPPAVSPPPVVNALSKPSTVLVSPETITSTVDLTYYGMRDVDVPPRALHAIMPDYLEGTDGQRLTGRVRLQLKIEADGRVSDVKVLIPSEIGVFEESIIKAYRDARFEPAQKNGRPVRALIVIEVGDAGEG